VKNGRLPRHQKNSFNLARIVRNIEFYKMPSSKRVASSGRRRGRRAGKRSNVGVCNPTVNVLDSSMVHPPSPAITTTRGRGRGATKRAKPSAKTPSHESDGSLISAAEAMAPVASPPSPTISLAFPLQSGQVVTSGDRVANGEVEVFMLARTLTVTAFRRTSTCYIRSRL